MSKEIQHILGLDLGTNSIGWALVEVDHIRHIVRIMMMGSRILPMAPAEIAAFENGRHIDSAAAERRKARQPRRMNERFILRRDRLNYVLNLYSMLPEHYRIEIDFETKNGQRCGKFHKGKEPKIAYRLNEEKHCDGKRDKYDFIFDSSYQDMITDIKRKYPTLEHKFIPKDWTLYYLRKKALTEEISLNELSWVLHSFNKKRGYEKVEGTDTETTSDAEIRICSVTDVATSGNTHAITLTDKDNPTWHFVYYEESLRPMSVAGDFKQVEIISVYDDEGKYNEAKSKYAIKEIITLSATDIKHAKKNQITFDNGWTWESTKMLDLNTPYTLICNQEYKSDGQLKKRSFALVDAKDKKTNWAYLKLDTETKIAQYNRINGTKGVASYIYDNLLCSNPSRLHTKIIGGLVESVERRFYHEEVLAILTQQAKYHDGFDSHYRETVEKLYPHNESHRRVLLQQSFAQLVADDILLYQRELKSKKSEISDCKYETYRFVKDGKEEVRPVKSAHTANPYFQEFRIWKFINQLRIIEEPNAEHASPIDVTEQYLTYDAKAALFDEFQRHKTIKVSILQKPFFHLPNKGKGYTWNYETDHEESGNETRYDLMCRLRKVEGFDWESFLNATHLDNGKLVSNEYMLWHFFYSVKRKSQRTKGLPTLVARLLKYAQIDGGCCDELVKNLSTFGSYKNNFGAYSEKALLKLLPLMRCGKYWDANEVARITGVEDDRECQGMMENGSTSHPGAVDIVYKDQLLAVNKERWTSPHDIRRYIKKGIKQNSLKNPVVEKVIREMLYVVHDIWQYNLNQDKEFAFDEIHIELGRELQRSPKQKKQEIDSSKANKLANKRAELILKEMKLESLSPFMREKYRIYEDCIMSAIRFDKKETVYEYKDEHKNIQTITKKQIEDIQKATEITPDELRIYRLWLDQRFSSPYTGQMISLSELFDGHKYQREHVFPRERVTLNSLKNLVMCEAAVNKAKLAMTGMQFIKEYGGKEVGGHRILTEEEYRSWVDNNVHDDARREILLCEQIPDRFTNNQLNNTRYISRLATALLSHIVRTDNERGALAAGVIPVNGSVTSILRHDWHMGETWRELITPRFRRMNTAIEKLTGIPTTLFGEEREVRGHSVFVPTVPQQFRDDFEIKRIDHRHHALDALVVALTERAHIQYISNVSGEKNSKDALNARKALKEKHTFSERINADSKETRFLPPMQYKQRSIVVPYTYEYVRQNGEQMVSPLFEDIVLAALQETVVTFKQNTRIMSPRQNLYQHWSADDGRIVTTQESGLNDKRKWCLRLPAPSSTIYGKRIVNGENFLSTKWGHSLEAFASVAKDKILSTINNVPDKAVRDILIKYLAYCNQNPEVAFSPAGIAYMNEHIKEFTPNGKNHLPIYKVSLLQRTAKGHPLSPNGGVKSRQYSKDNGNVLCYFYPDKVLVKTLDMFVRGEDMPDGYAFTLCANELVYVPTDEESQRLESLKSQQSISISDIGICTLEISRLYKAVSFDPSDCTSTVWFTPVTFAQMLLNEKFNDNGHLVNTKCKVVEIQGEFALTSEKAKGTREFYADRLVRDICWKVVLDRLGQIDHFITREGIIIK